MPFKKGQSGNPKGAPKKEQTFAKCFEKAIDELEVNVKNDKTGKPDKKIKGKEVIVQAYIDLAFNKQYPPAIRQRALDTIVERIDGKARQTVSVDGEMKTNSPSIMDILKDEKNQTETTKKLIQEVLKNG